MEGRKEYIRAKDIRAKRTEQRLKETLLRMLEKKQISEIRVSELCKLCEVNRTTFYDHYQDLYELSDAAEEDILLELSAMADALSGAYISDEEIIREMIRFLREHQRELSIFLLNGTGKSFMEKCNRIMLPFFERNVRLRYRIEDDPDSGKLASVLRFLTAGFYSMYYEYLNGSQEDGDAVRIASQISAHCLETFWPKV